MEKASFTRLRSYGVRYDRLGWTWDVGFLMPRDCVIILCTISGIGKLVWRGIWLLRCCHNVRNAMAAGNRV